VPELYARHRGQFSVSAWSGNPKALTKDERETVDSVIEFYGGKSSDWLSNLTHREAPWKEARGGLRAGDRGNAEITQAAMAEYYGSLG